MTVPEAYGLQFTALESAELVEVQPNGRPLAEDEVAGRTLRTLISSGTELACYQGLLKNMQFPLIRPGYSAVFEVTDVGSNVTALRPGDRAFCMGGHQSFQRVRQDEALLVPEGLDSEVALFARLMGVSMSTLTTTTARPPAKVIVTGLGPVGHLAAQIFASCGYEVLAVDPAEKRRAMAQQMGISDALPAIPLEDPAIAKQVALVVECSGHEQAVLDACNVVQKRGEVVLVGVPWKRQTDMLAHEILYAVFHNYVVLRSGWEWEVARHPTEFRLNSIFDNLAAALRWLEQGRIRVDGLFDTASPEEAQQVYQDLMHHRRERLAVVFDWCGLLPQ